MTELQVRVQLGDRKRTAIVAGVVILSALAVYGQTLSHGFAFDDVSEVVRNDYIRSLANLPRLFASGAWQGAGESNPIYRPLTTATYALNFAAGGLSPFGYHLVNVLLHALVSASVLWLGRLAGLSLGAAAFAAVLFAVHPVHAEVVANIAGRKDELTTAFAVLAVLAHASARRRGGAWRLVAPLAVTGALFSKESGAAALGLVLAWDVLLEPEASSRTRRGMLTLYAVYGAIFVLYLWSRQAAVGSVGVPLSSIPFVENPAAHASAGVRILTAAAVLGRGLGLLVFPRTLSADYSFDAVPVITTVWNPAFLVSAGALLLIGALAALCRRRWPLVTFCAAWYAIGILPAANLLLPVGTIFGERLLYLPSVGFCLGLGALLNIAWARHRAPVWRTAVIALLVVFAARAAAYAAVWSDEVSLFTEAVRAQPRSAKAHGLLGAAFMEQGRVAEGVRELEIAATIYARVPGEPAEPLIELGVAYERMGRLTDAEAVYDRVLQQHPDYPDALWRLGVVRWSQGRRDEAKQLWQQTVAVEPRHARALSDLGLAADAAGDTAAAEALWLQAIAADPHIAGPYLSLGDLYLRRGDPLRARAAWSKFLENARYGAYTQEREIVTERLRRMDSTATPSH